MAKQWNTDPLGALLVGYGPGTVKNSTIIGMVADLATWLKLFYEYGIIGSFIFVCFLASCLRRSRCPGFVIAAIMLRFLFASDIHDYNNRSMHVEWA